MPEFFAAQSPDIQPSRLTNDDRYTPMPDDNFDGQKAKLYHIEGQKNHNEPILDEQPYKLSSPLLNDGPLSAPELYHLTLPDENNSHDGRPSPGVMSSNRVTLTVPPNSHKQLPEVYYIQLENDNPGSSSAINKTKFDDNIIQADNHDQPMATMYMLTTDQENLPPSAPTHRTASPPIRSSKRQQQQQPISYNSVDNNNKFHITNHQHQSPATLDVGAIARSVPLTQSKASASIQRSMNKYRFADK